MTNVAISLRSIARVVASEDTQAAAGNEPLVRAVLQHAGVQGVALSLRNSFPVGAGLGGSSAASAALLGALHRWCGREVDRASIAEDGRRIEVDQLGVAGGRQDHYAATHGGALALTFTRAVQVRRLSLTHDTRRELLASATLIYTGESRMSGDTITAVLGAYEAGDRRVITALRHMRELAMSMATALEAGDVGAVGEMLDEHWYHQRALHPSIPTPRIDEIVTRARAAGALGAKAMGASGGGCVLVLCRPSQRPAVRSAVQSLGDILDFELDNDGLVVEETTTPS